MRVSKILSCNLTKISTYPPAPAAMSKTKMTTPIMRPELLDYASDGSQHRNEQAR